MKEFDSPNDSKKVIYIIIYSWLKTKMISHIGF